MNKMPIISYDMHWLLVNRNIIINKIYFTKEEFENQRISQWIWEDLFLLNLINPNKLNIVRYIVE